MHPHLSTITTFVIGVFETELKPLESCNMTLHEAIIQTIKQYDRPMTAIEIALELNNSKLYTKKDNTDIKSRQIEGRVENYPKLFSQNGTLIGLKSGSLQADSVEKPGGVIQAAKHENRHTLKISNPALQTKVLLNVKNFKPAGDIDSVVPNEPGIYAIRVKYVNALPKTFATILEDRKHNLLYIGVASESLKTRLLDKEIRAKGHGIFFRSLGAVLGYLPQEDSMGDESDKNNFSFSPNDEAAIIKWINANLRINWLCMVDGWEQLETQLILDQQPLLNIDKNPQALEELKSLLKKCVDRANS